ncbi:glucans biosynthesis glucosyltransferase MdoH [Roseibium polysiphoniae]|uniref:glucans biosynthesis glucosyltransferase MdoH n=1 Tax=Roseibium polysiphoniae TaxID=2571221 RepID=UPI003299A9EE
MQLQNSRVLPMTRRRIIFAGLVIISFFGLAGLMALTLATGDVGVLKGIIFTCFLLTLPWTIIGFWNAVIGLLTMRLAKDPAAYVCLIATGEKDAALTSQTAILSCIRDEDAELLETRLNAMLASLLRSGEAKSFSLFVLSDTSRDDIAMQEQAMVARLTSSWGADIPVAYRRRTENTGFKAGNIEDFCERWGGDYDFALVLDADSYMSADAILGLVRRMELNPRLGILQSLVVGLPTESAFARVFQFGMRLGMRSYTIGSAWWQGDCGPYWGHNALLRIKPFIENCKLPTLPGNGPLSGAILSHDQVEAVLMRRAGFEVRVLPQEGGSYEENPPHLLEFIRRDLRWCQGNFQYRRLLTMPGLLPVSRVQLFLAMLMFIGSPAWIGFMVSAALAGVTAADAPLFRAETGYALFITIMTMVFAPKLATVADILAQKDLRRGFGGTFRVLASALTEIVYSSMLAPIMAMAHTLFIGGLALGKTIGWGAQGREVEQLPLGLSASKLWPQTLFGVLAISWIATQPLATVWPVIPIALGPLLAVPFAVLSSSPSIGLMAIKSTLWRIPEETTPQAELSPLSLRALLDGPQTLSDDANSTHLPPQREPVRVKA